VFTDDAVGTRVLRPHVLPRRLDTPPRTACRRLILRDFAAGQIVSQVPTMVAGFVALVSERTEDDLIDRSVGLAQRQAQPRGWSPQPRILLVAGILPRVWLPGSLATLHDLAAQPV